ncbi:MAG: hypothetical protein PHC60_00765 [Heliobacteriaceae bacterium]|nr:hypothetical protein [Heliobacteriaceae bacterium]MDD4586912.1 hypothetical protein [Heliobacteriaceae bacterium]
MKVKVNVDDCSSHANFGINDQITQNRPFLSVVEPENYFVGLSLGVTT